MKPNLLHGSDEPTLQHPFNEQQLLQDLHLEPILKAMSRQDPNVYATMSKLLLDPLQDENTILRRQQVVKDTIRTPSLIHRMYEIVSDIDVQSAAYRAQMKPSFSRNVPIRDKLTTATALLDILLTKLRELRDLGAANKPLLLSKGLTDLVKMLEQTYTNEFLSAARTHHRYLQLAVQECRLSIGARIGNGLKGTGFTLRRIETASSFPLNRFKSGKSGSFLLGHDVKEIEESALSNVLRILKRFIDRCLNFTDLLRYESSFYVGCMNLYEDLVNRGCEVAFPLPLTSEERCFSFTGLYDPGLAIEFGRQPVTNELQADGKHVLMITGKNQGGKTTFLRSLGLAQLMMQSGMFVPASTYRASVCDRIFTHFTREEDKTMRSGKLDEELARLDQIVDHLTPRSLLLMNEPFASTTEREGSAIAMDLLSVCDELRLRVYIVTHFYELAGWAYAKLNHAVFLSPSRDNEGSHSYKLAYAEPSPTSYGEDLYNRIMTKPLG
ncbi:MutS-related protein [Cohnella herbarum]|uniref:DNA mismatch repair proteins mutS family domain-containing protein n=1 Tax=Cohnella herbarum TaxID=2728023 RepID=A0A7Z2VNR6_9BACL|nr:hypothetical protein [Cohnella herbarum]QJD86386.1 hypothetical protein HH215_26615 [Cohnella herbarum]